MRTKKIQIPIYYGSFTIIINPTDDFKAVAKKFGFETDFNLDNYGAFTESRVNSRGVLELFVCVDEKVENHLICHEVVHLVNTLYVHIGAQLDRHNDEHQAYLSGWFFSEIEKFLNKK